MEKSVYSVVLNDYLVDELDRLAFKKGVSRSVMLNKILTEYLNVETPDSLTENVFSRMEKLFCEIKGMKFVNNPSLYTASVSSALAYRYNPTLKYSLELFPAGDLGQLKISLRSQSRALFEKMENFYLLFIGIEKKYIGERSYFYQDGRFVRILKRPSSAGANEIGEAISAYVKEFDEYLKSYFLCDGDEKAAAVIEKDYADNLKNKKVIL